MNRCVLTTAVVAALAGTALAGPVWTRKEGPTSKRPPAVPQGQTDALPFSDNFDSYANGTGVVGQGTWQSWGAAVSLDATVSNAQSSSAPNSMKMVPQTDIVQAGNVTSGVWELKCMTYYPSTNVGPGTGDGGFIIGCNRFISGGVGMTNDYWSSQIQWHPGTNTVRNANITNGENTPIIPNQWVSFRQVVNLTTDKYDVYYNGVQFVTQRPWSTDVLAGGTVTVGCFDFYGGNLATTLPFEMYFDNISFTPVASCYANCDGSTGTPKLTGNDFTCFINAFATNQSYANCDGSTGTPALTGNDFTCFINAYATALGCS